MSDRGPEGFSAVKSFLPERGPNVLASNPSSSRNIVRLLGSTASGVLLLWSFPLFAQATSTRGSSSSTPTPATTAAKAAPVDASEIIVTARKRNESILDVPISVTEIGGKDLTKYSTRDFQALAQSVPGLFVSSIAGGGGGSVTLRGVGSSPDNPFIDQAVSFNIDGAQISSANIVRLGQIDMANIQILKGPQALFFGKNSPAGVIAIRTADPTDKFEIKGNLEHEFNGDETDGTVSVSGPVTDRLLARVVAYGDSLDGYFRNLTPDIPGVAFPGAQHAPRSREFYLRGTVLYNPIDNLKIRAKYGYDHLNSSDPFASYQRLACPDGHAQVAPYPQSTDPDNCKADRYYYNGAVNPSLTDPYKYLFPFVESALRSRQQLGSVEANYTVAPDITATSVTGYYKLYESFFGNASFSPVSSLPAGTTTKRREISEELRLATAKSNWPVNFTLGAYYQHSRVSNVNPVLLDLAAAGAPVPIGTPLAYFDNGLVSPGNAYSVFGQASWKIFRTLELAGGARWSKETKSLSVTQFGVPIPTGVDHESFSNVSPEVTLNWRPVRDLSLFGGYRTGFKSGGFNAGGGAAGPGVDLSYKPEKVRGFEGGIKYSTSQFRADLTAYTYKYLGLQVTTYDSVAVRQLLTNAAAARVKGLELDMSWQPRDIIEGLEFHGAVNLNSADYIDFIAGCYTGQTIAGGCDLGAPAPGAASTQQNLAGHPLSLAPKWTGSVGASYSHPLTDQVKITFTSDGEYSGQRFAQLEEDPNGRIKSDWLLSASVRIAPDDQKWALAFIGRNLGNVYRPSIVIGAPLTGNAAFTGTNNEGGRSDLAGALNRGRELRLQLSFAL